MTRRNGSGKTPNPAVTVDVTDCLSARIAAQQNCDLWASILQQSGEGIMICDSQQRILLVNAAFERLTGFAARDAIGETPKILHSGRQDRMFYANMWRSICETGCWSGEIWNRRRSGDEYVEWLTIKAVYGEHAAVIYYVGTFSDITQYKATEARVQHLAEYDSLTELPNRALLNNRLAQLTDATRRTNSRFGVVFIDLDRFNNVNDSMGHDAGDQLLQIVARRIEAAVRLGDTIARMGADEFVVLLPNLRHPSAAASVAHKILDAISVPVTLRAQSLTVCASAGICVFPDDGSKSEELIVNAAAAMTRAKHGRRNSYQFYTAEMNSQAAAKLRLENELRAALEQDQLVLHFQPQVDLGSGALVGAEALVRWNRPGADLVPPAEFIPLAEERGLILPIGRWVVEQTLRQIRHWDAIGLPPITIGINLTATEFGHPDFVAELERAIGEHGIAPGRLEIELTENVAAQDLDATARILERLHSLGVRLSLDDFGTGYSSLSYLQHFPIDKIKIDQSFVRALTDRPQAIRIVRAIIALARSFTMTVIAEGVETAEQLSALRAEHCDQIQGFLVAKALPAQEFEQLVRAWKPWTHPSEADH
jgi:diguanylate cyclase (GGDEF)-like protein/PAS domain S-box-containing protein